MVNNNVIQDQVDALGDRAICRVRPEEKRSTLEVSLVVAGFVICMSGLFTGAAMAAGLNLRDAIIATILGNAILAFYGGWVGSAGAREGVGSAMLSRHAFGRKGSMIVGGVLALTHIGWFSVQVGFFGQTMNSMFPNAGFITSIPIAALWGGILMMLTAYFGYKGLSTLSKIAIPLILITAIAGIWAAVNHSGGWSEIFAIQPSKPTSIATGIVLAVGSFAAGASAQADITRYAKSASAAWIATFFGFIIANSFVIVAGLITLLAIGDGNLPAAMIQLGLGIPALIVLIAGQWTTNDNNLYTSSLGIANLIKVKKKKIVAVSGIIATLIGVAGLADYFVQWLIVLGVGVPPMAGIIIADYWIIKKGKYNYGPGTKYAVIYWPAFIAWILASIGGFMIKWGTSALNSLVLGIVLYLIFDYIAKTLNLNASSGTDIEDSDGF